MTLPEIAEAMNTLFRKYGLDHDVVTVRYTDRGHPNVTIHIDQRENEPDPMKWRAVEKNAAVQTPSEEIVLVGGDNVGEMDLLLSTLEYIFQEYFTVHPPTEQLRLF
jgi:hypothetical protein